MTFDLGREEIPIPGSDQSIGLYSPERTIADPFRLRGEIGYELARDALKELASPRRETRTPHRLAAALPGAKTPILTALHALA